MTKSYEFRIHEKYAVTEIDEEHTLMNSEQNTVLLKSELASALIHAINTKPIAQDEIIDQYLTVENAGDILVTLHQLEKEGYITQQPSYFSREQTAYWEGLGYCTRLLFNVLQKKPVDIVSFDTVSAPLLHSAFNTIGLIVNKESKLKIILVNDYLNSSLEKINTNARESGHNILLLKLQGTKPYIGPLIQTNNTESACWKCLEHRLLLHQKEHQLNNMPGTKFSTIKQPVVAHPIAQQLAANTAALEIVSHLYNKANTSLHNRILVIDTVSGEKEEHCITPRPQCPVCGSIKDIHHPPPVKLEKDTSIKSTLGGYRSVTPEETYQKYKHHISPITGVVPYLKPHFTSHKELIHNYESGRNLAFKSHSLFWLNQHLRSGNGGKGKTANQARTGALCEAIERYSLMYHGSTYTVKGSFSTLKNAIHPNDCLLFSEQQYKNRDEINSKSSKFHTLIPVYLHENEATDWTPVFNLTQQHFNYLPAAYCYAQYPAEDEKSLYAYPDSNGCASGNTLEEAILQGFLELVERDAAAIWWYNRIERPSVDLSSAQNGYLNSMVKYYQEINRSLIVLDITTDLGIPVFVAISHCLDPNAKDQVIYAFGAHMDAHMALERSVIELNQLLPIVHDNNGQYRTKDQAFIEWLEQASVSDHPYLMPSTIKIKNMQTDYPQLCKPTIYNSIQYGIDQTIKLGMDMLVVDLTQPDVGMPVAKVIVPGLRHFWRRTGLGRLYSVPVRLNWLTEENSEEDLNPYSIII